MKTSNFHKNSMKYKIYFYVFFLYFNSTLLVKKTDFLIDKYSFLINLFFNFFYYLNSSS